MNEQWSKNFMKKLGVCMSDNQKALFVIESVILLSPMLLIIAIIVLFSITFILDGVAEAAVILYIACAFFILLTLLPNLFFYFLRNKLDLRIETFLYGIGFLSNIVSGFVVLLFLGSLLDMPVLEGEVLSLLLLVLSFASLFYTYAAALKKNEKGINKITFFLLMITIVFFVALIIKDFEILKQKESYELFTFCLLPMLFGLYIGHYAVYKTIWISLRNIAWTPFLLMCIFFFVTLLSAIIFYSLEILNKLLTSIVTAIILYFLSSFIISCLIGMVCKYFKKNQAEAQTNE